MPQTPDEHYEFLRRSLTDTGFLARNVLGFNYDEDASAKRFNQGSGGIRNEKPYDQITEFIDDDSKKRKLILLPRGTYKSTYAVSYCTRRILANVNVTIAYGMLTLAQAKLKSLAIRKIIAKNARIKAHFGDLKGDTNEWSAGAWTIGARTDETLQDPTFRTWGVDAPMTGGHPQVLIVDDICDQRSVRTQKGIENTQYAYRSLFPLMTHGCVIIVFGTRWGDMDIYSEILADSTFDCLVMDSGFTASENEDGHKIVVGGPARFPALTKERLEKELISMNDFGLWMGQWNNQISYGARQPFRREWFRPVSLNKDEIDGLTGYIISDSATKNGEENCFSVIGYVGLNEYLDCFVLDWAMGHWLPNQFEDEFLKMLVKWGVMVGIHGGELLENTTANQVYEAHLDTKSRARGLRLNLIKVPRSGGEQGKTPRILRLQQRFEGREIFWNSTIPRFFNDLKETRVLFDPEGFAEVNGAPLPSGELVDQFIKFPRYRWNDGPDALADIDQVDKSGTRLCPYIHARSRRKRRKKRVGAETVFLGFTGPGGLDSESAAGQDPLQTDRWARLRGP